MQAKSVGDQYRWCCYQLDFDPENVGYKQGWYRTLNRRLAQFLRMEPWTFLMTKDTVVPRGDYTTGTVTLTNGSASVVGVGTTWDTDMEPAWIAPGTDPAPDDFVRIGRVAGTTQLYLVNPYPFTTAAGTAYVIRHRYVRCPADMLTPTGMMCRTQNYGPLSFISTEEERTYWYDERITGTPTCYTPANPEPWQKGQQTPPTPGTGPTVSYSAAASTLTTGTVYQYLYTWLMHGIETAASPIVEATPVPGTPSVVLSGMERLGAAEGRYGRIYRAVKDVGIFKKIADVTTTSYTDSGTAVDEAVVYYENNDMQWLRFYPRPGAGDTYPVELSYQMRPRDMQMDSDRLPFPPDAVDYVVNATMADMAMKYNNLAAAARFERDADKALTTCKRLYIAWTPQVMERTGLVVPGLRYRLEVPGRRSLT